MVKICYWPDFDQILIVGSWDLFEHILLVTVTFVKQICPPKKFAKFKIATTKKVPKKISQEKFLP